LQIKYGAIRLAEQEKNNLGILRILGISELLKRFEDYSYKQKNYLEHPEDETYLMELGKIIKSNNIYVKKPKCKNEELIFG